MLQQYYLKNPLPTVKRPEPPALIGHQREYLEKYATSEVAAIFAPMGSGKTKMVIENACRLSKKDQINAMVFVTMKSVARLFIKNELPRHWHNDIPYSVVLQISGMNANEKKEQKKALERDCFKILVLNHGQLIDPKGQVILERFLSNYECLLVIDESSKIKNSLTKAAIKYGAMAKFRRIMSGLSLTNNITTLYSQFAFLNQDILGFRNHTTFKTYYCNMARKKAANGRNYDKIVGFRNVDELREKIDPFTFYRTKEQCKDLPPKVSEWFECELTPDQKRIYKEMIEEIQALIKDPPKKLTPEKQLLWAIDNNAFITGENPQSQLSRLIQLLSGLENGSVETHRYNDLLEILETIDGQVVIWCNFLYEIKRINDLLGNDGVIYYEGMSLAEQEDAIQAFGNGVVKYFVVNPASADIGFEALKVATYQIYFSNNYNLDLRIQSEDRFSWSGQKNSVTIIDMVTLGKIDEVILNELEQKKFNAALDMAFR